jgi:hypothetical protein
VTLGSVEQGRLKRMFMFEQYFGSSKFESQAWPRLYSIIISVPSDEYLHMLCLVHSRLSGKGA